MAKSNQPERMITADELLENLINDYTTSKQSSLIRMKKGLLGRADFMNEARKHVRSYYAADRQTQEDVLRFFEQYIFGYSRLSPLIDDPEVSDIRCVSYDNIRIKKNGRRMDSGITFSSEREYRQFVDFVATKNQVNISNLNAIQRFADTESHPGFILRFTVSMPLVNTYPEPYLCIRKVPRDFPEIAELVKKRMVAPELTELLVQRFHQGSTLICGGNSSGKTTLLNALKETIPEDRAVLVAQQADELTTKRHPDMMFLHSLAGTAESQVNYDLENISIAGLTMDAAALQRARENKRELVFQEKKKRDWISRYEHLFLYSGLGKRFPVLTVEVWSVCLILSGVGVYAVVLILGKSWALSLLAMAGDVGLLIYLEILLAMRNYKAVDNSLMEFLNLLGNYSITAGEVTGVFHQISRYLEEPLRSALDECYYEAQTSGDTGMALLALADKIEHPKFKELISSVEICARYSAVNV